MSDDDKIDGRINGPQDTPEDKDAALTVVQFILRLINNDTPNERLAEFGESLGIWMAKAGRYLVAASEVKPWPWTELD